MQLGSERLVGNEIYELHDGYLWLRSVSYRNR